MVKTTRRGYFGAFVVLAAMMLLGVLAGSSGAAAGDTTRVSIADGSGAQANGGSFNPRTSADGRYVAFESTASNLVAGDTNNVSDVFVRDRTLGTTERVSVDSSGSQANACTSSGISNGGSSTPTISADGRYVAFISDTCNLVVGDTNGASDVFVRDRTLGTTERVSVDSSGNQANGFSARPHISADGRRVAFESLAGNLVAGDTNNTRDIFLRDLQERTTERVSVDSSGNQANGSSIESAISADGRYVAFGSVAPNLVTDDTNNSLDIFVRDRTLGRTERVSVDSSGNQVSGFTNRVSISTDGRYVVFTSQAPNLVADDTNSTIDVFVRDRQEGTTERVSVDSCGNQAMVVAHETYITNSAISSDGRYVTFYSDLTNLVAGDTDSTTDVFVRDRTLGTTERVSGDSSGNQAMGGSQSSISADGRYIAFASGATNLVTGDTNGASDVFLHERRETQPKDCIAPTTTHTLSPTPNAAGWNNSDVSVALDATDTGGSGVKEIRYSAIGADAISEQTVAANMPAKFTIDAEGTTTINYFATDNAGNQEFPAKTLTVKIDKTSPEISETRPVENATGVAAIANITATFLEEGSGIAPRTLADSTFKVVQLKPTGNVRVSGKVSYDVSSKEATFDPSGSLAKGFYRATITTGVKDKAGNALANKYTWQFTTAGSSK